MKGPDNEESKRKKMLSESPKKTMITSYLNGNTRREFFKDSLKKDLTDSKLCAMILKIHYAIVEEYPLLSGMEYENVNKMNSNELKKCIIERIQFK